MSNENVVPFQNKQLALAVAVNNGIQGFIANGNAALPTQDDILVKNYVKKIEGDYDLSHSKHDTDNAIDLIYIAYNTVPQEMAQGRIGLSKMQQNLLNAQKNASSSMAGSSHNAQLIVKQIGSTYPIWLDILNEQTIDELMENKDTVADFKDFLKNDLIPLTAFIQKKSTEIAVKLETVSKEYESLVAEAQDVSIKTQQSLASEITKRDDLKKTIAGFEADKAKYDALKESLASELADLEKKNAEYEKRAKSAESRAFITGLTSAIVGGIAGLVPMAVMVANPALGVAMQASKAISTPSSSTPPDSTTQTSVVEAEKQKKAAEKKANETEQETTNADIKEKELAKKALENEVKTNAELTIEQIAEKNKLIDALDVDITKLLTKQTALVEALKILDSTLLGLKNDLSGLSKEERSVAQTLYEKQDLILEQISQLHKEERKQIGEIAKLESLIKSGAEEEKKVDISIFSLNLSIKSIMKCKEIIDTIALFFRNFSDFMVEIKDEAELFIADFERFNSADRVRKALFIKTIDSVNRIFVDQSARWMASAIICEQFNDNFKDGWSKLNKLYGTYLTGEELNDYLHQAKGRLNEIIAERTLNQEQQDAMCEKAKREKLKEAV